MVDTPIETVLNLRRCDWVRKPLDIPYHDLEWGVPVHDDRLLLEFLILEGAQAGLSWSTILAKREGYRKAFHRRFECGQGFAELLGRGQRWVSHGRDDSTSGWAGVTYTVGRSPSTRRLSRSRHVGAPPGRSSSRDAA